MLVIAEYILVAVTSVAIATHQVSHVTVLLTLTLFISLINRRRAYKRMLLHNRQSNAETQSFA